jgi:hypothetical protein
MSRHRSARQKQTAEYQPDAQEWAPRCDTARFGAREQTRTRRGCFERRPI